MHIHNTHTTQTHTHTHTHTLTHTHTHTHTQVLTAPPVLPSVDDEVVVLRWLPGIAGAYPHTQTPPLRGRAFALLGPLIPLPSILTTFYFVFVFLLGWEGAELSVQKSK